MTIPAELDVVVAPDNDAGTSYVDWPAIIAGIVLASAISILLLTFGSAIGLSFTNFNARPDVSPVWVAIAAASWLLWVQISSFMAGGYLTGRLRKRHEDATEEESDVRDGAHGLLVWAGALIIGAVLAVSGIGAAANAVGSAVATATTAASNVAGGAAEAIDPNAYFVDMLYRPAPAMATAEASAATEPATTTDTPASTTAPAAGTPAADTAATTPVAGATTPAAGAAAPAASAPVEPVTASASAQADPEAVRGETTRIFARAAMGELPDSDRTYLGQLVAQQTGLSEEEASARVDEVMTAMDTAKAEAAEAAEAARKTGVIGAFIIAASLLVSAIGAFWAAQKGGNHRDNNTSFAGVFRRF